MYAAALNPDARDAEDLGHRAYFAARIACTAASTSARGTSRSLRSVMLRIFTTPFASSSPP